jgi:hypothetical protein
MFRRGYSCGPPTVARLGRATLWKNSGCLFLEPVRRQRRVRSWASLASVHSEARTPRLEVFRAVLMRTTRSIAVVIAVVLSACAAEQRDPLTPRAPTLKEQSLLLKTGMSELEVTKLLGMPSKAEVGRCGENTPTPWTCKTWTYGRRCASRCRTTSTRRRSTASTNCSPKWRWPTPPVTSARCPLF